VFIGHYALGLGAKRIEPELPLGLLLAAPQVLDLVWPIFVLAGVEHVEIDPGNTAFTPLNFVSYPFSHSLVASLVWAVVTMLLVRTFTRVSWRATAIVGALVVSHWVLDVASHGPDMPIYWPDGPQIGLGLWNSVPATLIVEIGMFAGGTFLYLRSTRAKDRIGRWGLAGLLGFLFVVYLAASFGPPPPSGKAVAASALALWLVPLVGIWIERHRSVV
jgi:hypothetical protein